MPHVPIDCQVLGMDIPGSWILEAKLEVQALYKVILSLLTNKAWVSGEISYQFYICM